MAILTSAVTFEGDDAGFFLKTVTETPEITSFGFELIDDVVNNKYIYLNTEKDLITKKRVGCGFVSTGTGNTIYRKLINPVEFQAQESQCADVFDDTVFRKGLKRGVDVNDLTGTDVEKLLLSFVEPAILRDATRIMWLADTALASTDYNQMDGIYKILKAGSVSDGIINIGALSASAVSSTNIIATLKSIVDGANIKLRQVPVEQKALYVTETVWNGYRDWMQTNAALQSSKDETVNGVSVLRYQGIELIKLSFVDLYLAAHFVFGSPSAIENPNRVVYMKKDNLVLVLDTVARYNEIKFWYDMTTDMNYYRVRYQMQVAYKYPELVTIAGF